MTITITPPIRIVPLHPARVIETCHPNAASIVPPTIQDWEHTYADGIWQLGSVLKPIASIVRTYAEREGLDYTEAVRSLVAEYFVLRYDRYVAKYDASYGLSFLDFCKMQFVYSVRTMASRERRARDRQEGKTGGIESRPLDMILETEAHSRLVVEGCQVCKAIDHEERQVELQRLADLAELVKSLDSVASFVVWNHTGLGKTYEELAEYLGKSRSTVKNIHVGAIATLRRVMGVR